MYTRDVKTQLATVVESSDCRPQRPDHSFYRTFITANFFGFTFALQLTMIYDGLPDGVEPQRPEGSLEEEPAASVSVPRPPLTAEERRRIQAKYHEKIKERKIRIYQNALEEVIRREKASSMRHVVFKIPIHTRFGQNVCLVGSDATVGGWIAEKAVNMIWTDNSVWCCELKFPRETTRVEYKYLIKEGNYVIWEPGQNHVVDLRRLQELGQPNLSRGVESARVIQDSWGRGDAQDL
ncbi:starch binding domain-containing protein [Toxoplasma gondii GT1]|uniref:Starch binding domain-containing protein n=2 Tax=Toxoplasma gondii TaxID=5811 RepID=S7W1E0_TOXGG|nr:starch binding domain-containing protein [Toxoplasma gondii GT1]KAF4639618.1 starch binding domain-containing protein [Toxoplasma gondii]